MKKTLTAFLAAAAIALSAAPIKPTFYNKGDWRIGTSENLTKKAAKLKQIQLAFFGDSITQGWTMYWVKINGMKAWKKEFGKYSSKVNFGISGDKIENLHWRITDGKQLDGYKAKVIVLMIGANNLGKNTPQEMADGIKNVLVTMQQKQPQAKIILCSLLPVDWQMKNYKAVNEIICKFADSKSIYYLDLAPLFLKENGKTQRLKDGLHPNEEGYFLMAEKIRMEIDRVLQKK